MYHYYFIIERLLVHSDISAANMMSLTVNLWTLSNKHGHVSNKLKVNSSTSPTQPLQVIPTG